MSAPRRNTQQESSWIKTAATFAGGALAGAALAGMAYLAATEEDRTRPTDQQMRHQTLTGQRPPMNRSDSKDSLEEEKVEGVVKVCEICFVDFEELKGHDIHIMATPCGHVFCRVCIEEALGRQPRCPHCRQHVTVQNLSRLYL